MSAYVRRTHAHRVTDGEASRGGRVTLVAEARPAFECGRAFDSFEPRIRLFLEQPDALLQFVGVDVALFDQHTGDAIQPVLEVGGAEVVRGVHALDAVAKLVDVHQPGAHRRVVDRDDRRLPRLQGGIVSLDRTEAVHAADVVNTVHRIPQGGSIGGSSLTHAERAPVTR